ncbi:Mss4-like protein [Phyllosticta capitalensis]|uniref:Mss4-like protein n=1 Tax=Phyllosticta capitalensis TaxID=121624 RepID=A0ABR1YHP0_9PEZI
MPPPPPPTPQTGSCLCGLITYTITPNAPPVYSVLCHCDNCKKATGGHFICNTIYQKQHFTLTHGSPKAYRDAATDSGTPLYRHFCGDCGSNLWITTPLVEGIVSVLTGTLDAGVAREAWRPNKEQYIEAKAHWLPDFDLIEKPGVAMRHERGPSLDAFKSSSSSSN